MLFVIKLFDHEVKATVLLIFVKDRIGYWLLCNKTQHCLVYPRKRPGTRDWDTIPGKDLGLEAGIPLEKAWDPEIGYPSLPRPGEQTNKPKTLPSPLQLLQLFHRLYSCFIAIILLFSSSSKRSIHVWVVNPTFLAKYMYHFEIL